MNRLAQTFLAVLLLCLPLLPAQANSRTTPQSVPSTGPTRRLVWQRLYYPVLPSPRMDFAMTLDTDRQVALLFGGNNPNTYEYNDTWESNGEQWTQLSAVGPLGRIGANLAYDEARKEAILFGGFHQSEFLGSTWKFTPYHWQQQFPSNSPPQRAYASMAYDAAREQVVLFGGEYFTYDVRLLNDTWTWDGQNWQQQSPQNKPPARDRAQMVYDRARQKIVLYGGGSYAIGLSDTWIWDGTNWIQQHPIHDPSVQVGYGMAYDESRQQVILFGYDSSRPEISSGTWAWDGQDWIRLETYQDPPAGMATGGQMVYLPALHTVVVIYNLRPGKCLYPPCTPPEEMQVWELTEGYLSYLPLISR